MRMVPPGNQVVLDLRVPYYCVGDTGAPLPLSPLGLGRLGASGSDARG